MSIGGSHVTGGNDRNTRSWGSGFEPVTPSSPLSAKQPDELPGTGVMALKGGNGDVGGSTEVQRAVKFDEQELAVRKKNSRQDALRRALTAVSSKTTSTDATSLGGLIYVMSFFGLAKGRTYKPAYTIEEVEAKLYDIQHHDTKTRLLEQKSIISVDDDELNEENTDVRSRIIRCFTDKCAWNAAVLLLLSVLCTFIVTPITFIYGGTWSEPTGKIVFGDMTAVIAVDMLMDFIYAGYLLLQLNMSFMHPTRRVEVTCRMRILRRWSLCPFYYVKWLSATIYIWIIACDAPLLLNNIKLVRVVHWISFPDALWLSEENSFMRLGRLIFLLMGCSHWVACVLFWGGGYREQLLELGENAPLLRFNAEDLPGTGQLRLYLMALVEAIYMMIGALDNPVGDGSARENNVAAFILVSVFGPIGMVVVAILIAAVVREQALQFALEIRHEENMAFVTRALENLNIPAELQRRVVSLHYFQKMSHDTEAFFHLFNKNNLSEPLEDAIRVYLYHKVLMSSFFTHGGPNYLLAVVRVLEDRMYLPGDYVARRGEVGAEMFFISRGELSVLVPGADSDDISDAVLIPGRKGKGHHFGEVALVKRSLRTAWVRAETYVIVSVLHRHCIEDIWEFFPQEREALIAVVTQTMERDKARQKKGWKDAVQDVVAANNASVPITALPPASTSRPSTARASRASRHPGMANLAELAMRKSGVNNHCSHNSHNPRPSQNVVGFKASESFESADDRRHREAMEAAGKQLQRIQVLEDQVAKVIGLLEDVLPLASKSRCAKSLKKKKKSHAAGECDAQRLAVGVEAEEQSVLGEYERGRE